MVEDHDAVANLEIRDALTNGNDLPGHFMPEDARRGMRAGGDLLEVGAADAAGMNAYQSFAGTDLRHRNRFEANIILAAIHRGAHRDGNRWPSYDLSFAGGLHLDLLARRAH
jgi:hypothetical protein